MTLAERAVKAKGWRWLPGMLPDSAPSNGHNGQGKPRQISVHRVTPNGLKFNADRYEKALPLLTDPATLGCLLHLVREAWGDPRITTSADPPHIRLGWSVMQITDWEPGGVVSYDSIATGKTEAEALVAALESAP